MKYSIASAAALMQLAAAQHFTNSSTTVTTPATTTVGTGFWTSTVKPTGVTTITEVVETVVTYCPAPTTLTLGPGKTYTVTAPGTVTITDCPCTLSKAVSTEVVTAYTTYCPAPTTITQGTQEYTITAPGVATITNCPCTLTHPIAAPAPTSPAQAPAAPPAAPAAPAAPGAPGAPGAACPACPSCPAAQTVTVTVGQNGVPVAPSGPAPSGPAPSGPAPSGPAPSGPAPSGPAPSGPAPTGPAPTGPAPTGPAPTGPAPGTTVVPPPVGPTTVVSPPPPSTTTVPTGKTCPLTLAGATYQYPHLIVEAPVPSGPFSATSYNATITPGQSAYLNFDIPASYAGKTCDVIFALPTQAQLETSSFMLSDSGALNFGRLSKPAVTGQMSGNTTVSSLGNWTPVPGNSFTAASGACEAGSTVGYKISSAGSSLSYFQDYNPCPIGLYVVAH